MAPSSTHLLPGVPLIESPLFEQSLSESDFSDEERRIASELNERGYAVINFPDANIDERVERVKAALAPCFGMTSVSDAGACGGGARIQDAWKSNNDVRAIAANPEIIRLLGRLYNRRAFPFQTLNFPVGTQQHMHSDSIHFSSIPERFMCGVWLAMEDVSADAGPLVYYPGSHKWPILSNDMLGRSGNDNRSGSAQSPYEPIWRAIVQQERIAPEIFCAKKGQALIWTANLLHGGFETNNSALTRWSQVTHYYFENCVYYTPAFSNELVGRLDLRTIVNIDSGQIEPSLHLGAELLPKQKTGHQTRLLSRLRSAYWGGRVALPNDFDPHQYLRLNQDVAMSTMDPATHYLRHGRKEGRRYK